MKTMFMVLALLASVYVGAVEIGKADFKQAPTVAGEATVTSTAWDGSNWLSDTVAPVQSAVQGALTDPAPGSASSRVLLLHFDGTDGATATTDSAIAGAAPHTITFAGDAQLDTAQKRFGTASLLLDGTGDYASAADSPDWDFGASDFQIDYWVRYNVVTDFSVHLSNWLNNDEGWMIYRVNANQLHFQYSVNGSSDLTMAASFVFRVGQWYHICYRRAGSMLTLWINGTQVGWHDIGAATIFNSTQGLVIGGTGDGTLNLNGWIDEVSIVKGAYVNTLLPPQKPYKP